MVKICYDPEGDLLEIQFTQSPKARRGIGLTDQITLFCDEDLQVPLGLTATAYTRLLTCSKLPLTELMEALPEIQQKVRRLLQQPVLTHFIRLENDFIELEDLRISELTGASPSSG
jgi:hypothetical protein